MKTTIQLGAEIDVVTPGEMTAALRRLEDQLRALPLMRPLAGNCTCDSSGAGVIDLGCPGEGYRWEVKRLVVTPPDPATNVVGGVVSAYRVMAEGAAYFVDQTDAVKGIPQGGTAHWTSETFTLESGEHLYLRATGWASGQQIVASASVRETLERRVEN